MCPSSSVRHVLGLDVGAVSLTVAEIDPEGELLRSFYEVHHGKVESCLEGVLEKVDLCRIHLVASTTSSPVFVQSHKRVDNQICLITGVRHRHPEVRSILVVGGERFGLVRFDQNGTYLSYKANSLCAAGTGSFLDQQARRLNLNGIRTLADLALSNSDPRPKIASRCAVFAKTDLVHAQQEGHSLEAICDGLCLGVAKNVVDTLFTGEVIHGPLLLVGGVARNQAVVEHLESLLDVEVLVDGCLPHGALGAALKILGQESSAPERLFRIPADFVDRTSAGKSYEYPGLELRLSDYPDFSSLERYDFTGALVEHSHELEVDLYQTIPSGVQVPVYLGLDVGSTSTKAVVTDGKGVVLSGFYTATAGKPLVATQLILEAVADWKLEKGLDLRIQGVGTTGAGRKFIGKILGADLILDEITAHARAAVELNPKVDTIIEIGGLDAKFTTLKDGRVTSATMNT